MVIDFHASTKCSQIVTVHHKRKQIKIRPPPLKKNITEFEINKSGLIPHELSISLSSAAAAAAMTFDCD